MLLNRAKHHIFFNLRRFARFGIMHATLLKVTLLHGSFSRFLNCANATKSRKAPHFPQFETLCAIWYHACNFTKNNTPPWEFSRFLNYTNVTKSRKAQHLPQFETLCAIWYHGCNLFLKTPSFPRALKKLQFWVNFSIFSYLEFLSVFICTYMVENDVYC